jgi:hypothetical protein
MPQVADAPDSLNTLHDKVYKKSLDQYKGDKSKASAVAWSAAKGAGWFKRKDGGWKKKGESEESYWQWYNFWKRVEYADLWNIGEVSTVESLGLVNDNGSDLVGFRARILMAVPGKSLNGRIYLPETLQQAARPYEGKPFILDHDIEHAERVVGVITHPRYGVEEGWDGQNTLDHSPREPC